MLLIFLVLYVYGHILNSVPVVRNTWEPREEIQSSYIRSESDSKVLAVNMTMQTNTPTLRLANFIQISKIYCLDMKLGLDFTTHEDATQAFQAWNNITQLNVIIPHESNCSDTVSTRQVLKLNQTGSTLNFETRIIPKEEAIESYVINVAEYDVSKLHRRMTLDKGFNMNFDWNYNQTGPTFHPILFLKMRVFQIKDLWLKGDMKFKFYLKGNFKEITDYHVSANGYVRGAFDLGIPLAQDMEYSFMWDHDFVKIPLTPATIPGLFSFGPELRLNSFIDFQTDMNTALTIGFDFDIPFDFEASLEQRPPRNISDPTFHPHFKLPETKIPHKLEIGLHLQPQLYIPFSIFGKDLVSMVFSLDNSVGVITRNNNNTALGCTLDIELYRRHRITFRFQRGWNMVFWPLLDGGRQPLDCQFCKKCPKP